MRSEPDETYPLYQDIANRTQLVNTVKDMGASRTVSLTNCGDIPPDL